MKICLKCGSEFAILYKDNLGVVHNLCNRKYCFKCSPFGTYNNKQIHKDGVDLGEKYLCRECGADDKKMFYGKQYHICGKCHNKNVIARGQEKRKWAIDQLGGKCSICGYKTYLGAIEIHHTDPSKKDRTFHCLRGWSKERILKEIKNCIALCRNCHAEEHNRLNNT